MSSAVCASSTIVSPNAGVPRTELTSPAISVTRSTEGYRVEYAQPSSTPARAECGTSGLIMTTVPGRALMFPSGMLTSSTPPVTAPKTKPSWLWRGKVCRT